MANDFDEVTVEAPGLDSEPRRRRPAKAAAAEESSLTLRQVADDIRAWADTIAGLEEGTAEYAAALQEQAQSITAGAEKVDRFAAFVRRAKAEVEYLKAEGARITKRRQSIEALIESLRTYAHGVLVANALEKVTGSAGTYIKVKPLPDLAKITNQELIPAAYQVVVPATTMVDTEAVKKAVLAGEEIAGAELEINRTTLEIR